jgi:hypothetical protein
VLRALAHVGRLASGLLRRGPSERLDWEPHILDQATVSQPTLYEVEFLAQAVRYVYGLRFTDEAVLGEWLHAYPMGRRQVWFERDPEAPAWRSSTSGTASLRRLNATRARTSGTRRRAGHRLVSGCDSGVSGRRPRPRGGGSRPRPRG